MEQEQATLIPDKENYLPGDVAEILVQSPFSPAEGLLTVSRSGLLYTERFQIKNGSYTLDHSDSTYLIGMGGKPIWMSRYGQRIDYLAEDIRRLIAAGM